MYCFQILKCKHIENVKILNDIRQFCKFIHQQNNLEVSASIQLRCENSLNEPHKFEEHAKKWMFAKFECNQIKHFEFYKKNYCNTGFTGIPVLEKTNTEIFRFTSGIANPNHDVFSYVIFSVFYS